MYSESAAAGELASECRRRLIQGTHHRQRDTDRVRHQPSGSYGGYDISVGGWDGGHRRSALSRGSTIHLRRRRNQKLRTQIRQGQEQHVTQAAAELSGAVLTSLHLLRAAGDSACGEQRQPVRRSSSEADDSQYQTDRGLQRADLPLGIVHPCILPCHQAAPARSPLADHGRRIQERGAQAAGQSQAAICIGKRLFFNTHRSLVTACTLTGLTGERVQCESVRRRPRIDLRSCRRTG